MDFGLLIFSILISSGVLAIIWLALKPKYPIKYYEEQLLRMEIGDYDGAEIYFNKKSQMVTKAELRNEITRLKKVNESVNILLVIFSVVIITLIYNWLLQESRGGADEAKFFAILILIIICASSVRIILKNRSN